MIHRHRQSLFVSLVLSTSACTDDPPAAVDETNDTTDGSPTTTSADDEGSSSAADTTTTTTTIADSSSSSSETSAESEESGPATPTLDAIDDVVYAPIDGELVVAAADGVLANDVFTSQPGTILDFTAVTEGGGAVELAPDGSFTYTPLEGFWGDDAFTYQIGDGTTIDEARVTIWVSPKSMNVSTLADHGGFAITGTAGWGTFGYGIAGAGDVDGDGLADMVVGDPCTPFSMGGRVHVVFGAANVESTSIDEIGGGLAGFSFVVSNFDEWVGHTVDGAGDVNDDGLADIVFDSYNYNATETEVAVTYVVFGKGDDEPVSADDVRNGDGGFAILGAPFMGGRDIDVAGAGDVNGDGFDDVIIGLWFPSSIDDVGRAYVVFGKPDGEPVDLSEVAQGIGGFVIESEDVYEQAAGSVDGVGDVDGDGLDDVVIGARRAQVNGERPGRAHVVFGKADGEPVLLPDVVAGAGGFVIEGQPDDELGGDEMGVQVSRAGDIDGDGLDDVYVAASSRDDDGLAFRGAVFLVFGKSDGTAVRAADLVAGEGGFAILGANEGDRLGGQAIASGGDFDADGHHDLLAVAKRNEVLGQWYGEIEAVVVYGREGTAAVDLGATADGVTSFGLYSDQTSISQLRVAGLGDFDGDGIDDIAVAAPYDELDGYSAGRVYVMHGVRTDPTLP